MLGAASTDRHARRPKAPKCTQVHPLASPNPFSATYPRGHVREYGVPVGANTTRKSSNTFYLAGFREGALRFVQMTVFRDRNSVGERTSDEILMAAYQAGSEAAFGELYARHAGSVYGFLVRRLGDASLAEDLYQEAFLRLHRARDTYDSARPFRAWLFGIVHNLLTDTLRSRGRKRDATSLDEPATKVTGDHESVQEQVPSDAHSPEELTAARQSTTALNRALSALPSEEATVLILARLEGLSYDDIGTILGRSAAATKQLAYRALKRVRAHMVAEGYGEKL